jgi:hypothetical protein
MSTETWTPEDTARAKEIWAEYQQQHDVSHLHGKAVGIDPKSGRVWFGESIVDIDDQQNAVGDTAQLYFLRVGYDYYARKGGHR